MTLDDYIIKGYELFGPEAMKTATQFFSGEIDFNTCVDKMANPVADYYLQKEIREKTPKLIKMTSQFANYLDKRWNPIVEKPTTIPNGYKEAQFEGIPIIVDDTIENEYYEIVYEEEN